MKALFVGGTGPTGPYVARGLLDRGYQVTIYHRGFHEVEDMPPVHHHLHGDPYEKDALERDVAQDWDLVVCTYGRLRLVADVVANRTPKLVAVGGFVSYQHPENLPFPQGLGMPLPEEHPTFTEFSEEQRHSFAVAHTERKVMEHHQQGHFKAVIFRYAGLYHGLVPRNTLWPIVRRILDKRPHIIVPGDGSGFFPYMTAVNAAHMILLACDKSEGDGHIFNPVDERQYCTRDRIRIIADELKHDWEIVGITHPLADWCATGYADGAGHWPPLMDSFKLKTLLGYRDIEPPEQGIRIAARWLAEHRHLLNEPQIDKYVGANYAYDIEDRLIAAYKKCGEEISQAMPTPERVRVGNARENYRPDEFDNA